MIDKKMKTILLVEDEAILALGAKKSLERYGYKVEIVDSGEDAVASITNDPSIDLVLMDIDLGPGIDGPTAAEMILKDREIPIVFYSNHTEPDVVAKTEAITSYGYVVKNSSITVLDASIKMAFKLFEANQKLIATKDKLESTLGAIPDLIFEVGVDGRYYDCHTPDPDLLLIAQTEIIGKTVPEIMPPNIAVIAMSAIREANETGMSLGKQYELNVPAGPRWFELSISRMKKPSSDPRFIALIRDITERKHSEIALCESELRYRAMIENSPSPIGVHRNGKILYMNPAAIKLFGAISLDELVGKPIFELIHPDYHQFVIERVKNVLELGVLAPLTEEKYLKLDKTVLDLQAQGMRIIFDGQLTNLTFLHDVTESNRNASLLAESLDYNRKLISMMYDGFSVVNSKGIQIEVNHAFNKMTGFSNEELIGVGAPFPYWPPEEYENINSAFQKALNSSATNFDLIFMRKNGERFPVIVSPAPISNIVGDVKFYAATVKDMTDIKKAIT